MATRPDSTPTCSSTNAQPWTARGTTASSIGIPRILSALTPVVVLPLDDSASSDDHQPQRPTGRRAAAARTSEIYKTIALYAHFLDDHDADNWSNLFAPDAKLSMPAGELTGRDAIKNTIRATWARDPDQRVIHFCTTSVVRANVDTATAETEVSEYRASLRGSVPVPRSWAVLRSPGAPRRALAVPGASNPVPALTACSCAESERYVRRRIWMTRRQQLGAAAHPIDARAPGPPSPAESPGSCGSG